MMKKHDYKFIKEYVESFGYKLLSTEYKNANTKLKIECQEGHMFERTFSKFKQTQNCPYCTNTRKWNILEIKEYLKNIGYTLLSTEYKNNQTKLDMICSEGHKIHDTIKTQYCKNNNIRLIRIPYWDFDNIENILSQLLNINMNK